MGRYHARSRDTNGRGGAAWLVATVVLTALLGSVSLVACSSEDSDTRTNTFSVGSSPAVSVEVGNGDVDIRVGVDGEITVTANLQDLDRIEYEVSKSGDTVTVRAETKRDSRADVTLSVPQDCAFELATGNGKVDAVGLRASGQVNVGNGRIELAGIRGDVQANLGNGDIMLEDAEGSFILNDGNGGIELSEVKGSFVLNIGNGNVDFRGDLTAGGANLISAGSGSVTMGITGTPSVAIDLETDDGEVTSDLPVDVIESSEYKLVGIIGDGEADLNVRVGSGDIRIR